MISLIVCEFELRTYFFMLVLVMIIVDFSSGGGVQVDGYSTFSMIIIRQKKSKTFMNTKFTIIIITNRSHSKVECKCFKMNAMHKRLSELIKLMQIAFQMMVITNMFISFDECVYIQFNNHRSHCVC